MSAIAPKPQAGVELANNTPAIGLDRRHALPFRRQSSSYRDIARSLRTGLCLAAMARFVGSSQKRAIQNNRCRLGERGPARFEALGLMPIATLSDLWGAVWRKTALTHRAPICGWSFGSDRHGGTKSFERAGKPLIKIVSSRFARVEAGVG